jgi:hypothetical protein
MQKLQSQGVHHITLVGADRQTTIDFWEGLLGMPFVFEQPNLDNEAESHLYFDPGDGRLIGAVAGDVPADRSAARRPRHPAQRRSRTAASWTRSTSRISSACCAGGAQAGASTGATTTSRPSTPRTAIEALVQRSRGSLSDDRSPRNPYR